LLWHSQKGFECEDKSEQLNHIQKKEHHLITCTGGITRIILYAAKKKRKGIWSFLKKRKIILPGKKKPCCRFCAHENLNKYPKKN
jgi:hypothetical protein